MKSLSYLLPAGLALVALAACIVPPSMYGEYWQRDGRYRTEELASTSAPETAPVLLGEDEPVVQPSEAPLYSWDGGVVDGTPQGVSAAQGQPRGLEQPAPGRTHIIELYQQVLDERDGLAEEVELLRKSLEQTSIALDEETRKSNDLSARVAALEVGHRELMEDNQAIAARLVQAQIRRLEAEKMLLETRLEMEKQKEAEAAEAAAAARAPAGKAGAKPKAERPVAKDEPEGGHE